MVKSECLQYLSSILDQWYLEILLLLLLLLLLLKFSFYVLRIVPKRKKSRETRVAIQTYTNFGIVASKTQQQKKFVIL